MRTQPVLILIIPKHVTNEVVAFLTSHSFQYRFFKSCPSCAKMGLFINSSSNGYLTLLELFKRVQEVEEKQKQNYLNSCWIGISNVDGGKFYNVNSIQPQDVRVRRAKLKIIQTLLPFYKEYSTYEELTAEFSQLKVYCKKFGGVKTKYFKQWKKKAKKIQPKKSWLKRFKKLARQLNF